MISVLGMLPFASSASFLTSGVRATILSPVDSTSNTNAITAFTDGEGGGTAPWLTLGQIASGMNSGYTNSSYPAYGGYATTPLTNLGYTSGTVSWWDYPYYSPTDNSRYGMWGQASTGISSYFDAQHFGDNNLYIGWYFLGIDTRVVVAASSAMTQNAWNHYDFTWTSGAPSKLYWNGSLVATGSTNTTVGNVGTPLFIGTQPLGGGVGSAAITEEFEISNTERSAGWIATEYANQSSPSTFYTIGNESNPVPTTTSLSPTSTAAGGSDFTLTVNGTNFIASSSVLWNGSPRATTYVSSASLTATILAADITTAGTSSVTVSNPAPGGGTSNAQTFTITNQSVAATPTFSPGAGTYTSTQSVTISCTTPSNAIYYTIDGSTPTPSSTPYTSPVTVASSETLNAICTATGYQNSAVGSAAYVIQAAGEGGGGGGGGGGGTYIAPSVPTGLSATIISSSELDLSWNASTGSSGIAGYHIYRNGTLLSTTPSTTYKDTTVQPNTSYSYTVSAYDSLGVESAQSPPVTPGQQGQQQTNPPPSDVRIGSNILIDGTIYYLDPSGTKRPYTSAGGFLSFGFNSFKTVLTPNQDEISLPTGTFVYPMDGSLINDHGTIYAITQGKRAGFTKASVFLGLGYKWGNVLQGDTSFMNVLSPIDSTTQAHVPGTLISDHGTVYLLGTTGKLGIPSPDVFNSWGYSFAKVVSANSFDESIPMSGVMPERANEALSPL
jgi:hypothetical protein